MITSNEVAPTTSAEADENPTHAQWRQCDWKQYVRRCLTRFILTPNFNDRSTMTCASSIRNGSSLTEIARHANHTSHAWRNYSDSVSRSNTSTHPRSITSQLKRIKMKIGFIGLGIMGSR